MPQTPTNRLIHETSPYLLQHAHNPVDWLPWGDDAFVKARREDRPIFLSVGYSTCYWCHVMEAECFERDDVAAVLNAHFVPVKVDREERPDVDRQYLLATQMMTGSGGWPNSVWLTPDGRPWFAGTYFPREQFVGLLKALHEAWTTRRPDVQARADELARAIAQASAEPSGQGEPPDAGVVDRLVGLLENAYDAEHGGFGGAPKFPPHGALAVLIEECRRGRDGQLLAIVTHTLDAMAAGGIHDHVGGGFHRYATDARWFLPHFEKMLYDNAQLLRAYADAFELTGRDAYRATAAGIVGWVAREMLDPSGGFHSALDAGAVGREGEFYTWTLAELGRALGPDAGRRFADAYGFAPEGNWTEQATGHRPGTSIPHRPVGADDTPELAAGRAKLLEARNRRDRPHKDDKVLAGWNGLMIGALARAGGVFDEPAWLAMASRAAGFVTTAMRDDAGRLLRSYRAGEARQRAYLDDYAYLTDGLLDLHEATGERRWFEEAVGLVDVLLSDFQDRDGGGFYFAPSGGDGVLVRDKNVDVGGNVPTPNAVAAMVLQRLAAATGEVRYGESARRTLASLGAVIRQHPQAAEHAVLAVARSIPDRSCSGGVCRVAGDARRGGG